MNDHTVIYELATGAIRQAQSPPWATRPKWLDAFLEMTTYTGDPKDVLSTHYVIDGIITSRPEFKLTYQSDLAANEVFRIDGIPPGTQVKHPEGTIQVDDGFLEWSTNTPGEYKFRLSNFPHLEKVIYAHVTQA